MAVREVERLRQQLTECARGERFLLQGGDCAEDFADCTPDKIASKLCFLGVSSSSGALVSHLFSFCGLPTCVVLYI